MSINIPAEILELEKELIATRRDLHQHPELGYNEHRTSKIVVERLTELGYEVTSGIGKTGVVGLLRAEKENAPCIAFRADMDALPLEELNTHEFVSQTKGLMHACGHDAHVAILLGFARWLKSSAPKFPGHIKLVFQPAEEGGGGAVPMIEHGILESPKVEMMLGLHVWNQLHVGLAGVSSGPLMAATDEFEIKVIGKGGHGAIPQQTTDSIVAAAHVVLALQNISSRLVDPLEPVVISVGQLNAGSGQNIIAETALLRGTVRTFNRELREKLPAMIEETARSAAKIVGADVEYSMIRQYPPVINHQSGAALVKNAAIAVLGKESVQPAIPTMGGEDMAYYLEKVPGCFFWLGSANPDTGQDKPHHNPYFDIDESCMLSGVAIFAKCVEEFFAGK